MMATASRFASDATALLIPAATPVWRAATALMIAVVNGATVTAMPRPSTIIGRRNVAQYGPPAPGNANRTKPSAAMAGPMMSGARAPKRSSSPPAQRDSAAMTSVKGRNTAPASVAE
jgi:hypothetical protein